MDRHRVHRKLSMLILLLNVPQSCTKISRWASLLRRHCLLTFSSEGLGIIVRTLMLETHIAISVLTVRAVRRWCWRGSTSSWFSLRSTGNRFDGFGRIGLSFLCDTLRLLGDGFSLLRIFGDDINEIGWHWRIELKTIRKLFQIIKLDLFVISSFLHANCVDVFPLFVSECLVRV